MAQFYRYRPFKGPRNFRLLHLFRSISEDENQPIRGSLEELHLDRCPEYEALSYAWGAPHRTIPILLDDQIQYITDSCQLALRRLLRGRLNRAVWVDAICINQDDNEEKSTQVAMMDEIYSKATRVNVWLGAGDQASEEAAVTLNELAMKRLIAIAPGPFAQTREKAWRKSVEKMLALDEQRKSILPFGILGELFKRPWFHRMWVIQEVALADVSKTRYYLGNRILAPEVINYGTSYPREWGLPLSHNHFRGYTELTMMLRSAVQSRRAGSSEVPKVGLTALFWFLAHKDATNPADKIFGLYAIVKELGLGQYLPKPDYNKSVAQIYTEAARAAILQDSSLDTLYLIDGRVGTLNLPSWVPDFRDPSTTPLFGQQFNASAGSNPIFWFDESGSRLSLQGCFTDIIDICGQPLHSEVTSFRHLVQLGPTANQNLLSEVHQAFTAWHNMWIQHKAQYGTTPDGDLGFMNTVFFGGLMHQSQSDMVNDYAILMRHFLPNTAAYQPTLDLTHAARNFEKAVQAFAAVNVNKRLIKTQAGRVGIAPSRTRPSDVVVIFEGSRIPSIIRQVGQDFYFVGCVYLHDAMQGQLWPRDQSMIQDYTLA